MVSMYHSITQFHAVTQKKASFIYSYLLEVTQKADLGRNKGVSLELPLATKKIVNVLSSQWLNTFFIVICSFLGNSPASEF